MVVHFFGGGDLRPQPLVNAGTSSSLVQWDGSTAHMDDSAAAVSVMENIFSLSQELISKGPSDPGIANSLNSLKLIQSASGKNNSAVERGVLCNYHVFM